MPNPLKGDWANADEGGTGGVSQKMMIVKGKASEKSFWGLSLKHRIQLTHPFLKIDQNQEKTRPLKMGT